MPYTNALLEIIQSLPPARITAREQERTMNPPP